MNFRVALSTRRGFLAPYIAAGLEQLGVGVLAPHEVTPEDIFINLSNVHSSPDQNVSTAKQKFRESAAGLFVQVQSFATLHGIGRPNPTAINWGYSPLVRDDYVDGKLAVERALLQACSLSQRILLVYVPAVLGAGSSWEQVLHAMASGACKVPRFAEKIEMFNAIEASTIAKDIVTAAIALRRTDLAVGRAILNSPPDSAASFMAAVRSRGAGQHAVLESPAEALKLDVGAATLSIRRSLRRAGPPASAFGGGVPRYLTGVSRHALKYQPWFPPAMGFGVPDDGLAL